MTLPLLAANVIEFWYRRKYVLYATCLSLLLTIILGAILVADCPFTESPQAYSNTIVEPAMHFREV